jgi:hypothetical protein
MFEYLTAPLYWRLSILYPIRISSHRQCHSREYNRNIITLSKCAAAAFTIF